MQVQVVAAGLHWGSESRVLGSRVIVHSDPSDHRSLENPSRLETPCVFQDAVRGFVTV